VPIKPINIILGIVAALLFSAFLCLIVRLVFGIAMATNIAIGLFVTAVVIACIPLTFSIIYLAFDKVRHKGNERR